MVLVGLFLRSFGGGVCWVFSTQLLLQNTPGDIRGRVFSTDMALFTLASAIGAAVSGWILDSTTIGLAGMMRGMAVMVLIPGLLWSLWIFLAGAKRDWTQTPRSSNQTG